jgi:DNA-binding FadR family transcriptional regulator
MERPLEPLATTSLNKEFIRDFEGLILSGQLAISERPPPEREIATHLGVSRPVVHEGSSRCACCSRRRARGVLP